MRALTFILLLVQGSTAFVALSGRKTFESSKLFATSVSDKVKRAKILNRSGQHFSSRRENIEFGYTTKLDTDLKNSNEESIKEWLSDGNRVASGIWDKNLMKSLGGNKYRLELMTLKFLTIQLAPTIDVLMWTDMDSNGNPTFKLESVGYDPNVQVLPGMGVDAKALGIHIDVVGELEMASDGRGLSGRIGFVSSGKLLPPMRLVPQNALKVATGIINKTVSDFAVRSFEKGAQEEFRAFVSK